MASAKKRKYVERSSTRIDCPICMESYESIKILPCQHEICSQCLDQLITRGNLLCPQCRIAFNKDCDFKTKESWNLECFVCFKMKPSEELNWCVQCARLICCLCVMRQHKSSDHTIQEWDSGITVIAALNSEFHMDVDDYPRQQRLLKERIMKLIEPAVESISKSRIDSRNHGVKSLLQTFPSNTKNIGQLTPNGNGQEVLRIASKVSGINVEDLLHIPISLKDPSNTEDRIRSLINFGPENKFFDSFKEPENRESILDCSKILNKNAPFKIKADKKIECIRISVNLRKIVLSSENSEHIIYDLDIFNEPTSLPEILDRNCGTELSSDGIEKKATRDGIFDPARNRYFVLERVRTHPMYFCLSLSVIDLNLKERTWLWNSSKLLFGDGELTCSPSGVLFILMRQKDCFNECKTKIYTMQRNEQGETKAIVLKFKTNEFLNNPLCYEVGSDTFLLAYNYYKRQKFVYRFDGSKMTLEGSMLDHAGLLEHFNRGITVKYGNSFIKMCTKANKLTAFTRDGHDFEVSWKFERPYTEIKDVAVDGDRVLMALYKKKDDFVQFEWFSLAELRKNSA